MIYIMLYGYEKGFILKLPSLPQIILTDFQNMAKFLGLHLSFRKVENGSLIFL